MNKGVIKLIFAFTFFFFAVASFGQKKKMQKELDKQMEAMFGKPVEPTKEYKEAEQLVQQAIDLLKNGEVNAADALIKKSLQLYPVKNVFEYAKVLFQMPDINKANTIMNEAYDAVNTFPANDLLMREPFPSTYVDGKMIIGIKSYEKNRALFNFGYESYKLNKEFGNSKVTAASIDKMIHLDIKKNTSAAYDFEYNQQINSRWEVEILRGDYDKAIKLVEEMPLSQSFTEEGRANFLAYTYNEKGDYEKAIELAKKLKGTYENVGRKTLFMAYALSHRNEEAIQTYRKYVGEQYAMISNDLFYYLAVIDIDKKDFKSALNNLDSALHHKMGGFASDMSMEALFLDKWKVYKAYGDAYAGLNQFEKAKDNYNIALLFNPDYEPAIAALTKLESSIATTTSSDKTPPKIAVTEPSVKRGLQVTTAGSDIMVRGVAEDPSGLKSVSINGQNVYAQASGNFWGNIVLKDGLNKITIKATDGAGNIAEETFEITKNTTTTSEPEIVAVTAKEGKNYCLLIAAQNYADATIPSLENPIQDAVRLKLVLKKNYNFTDENIFTLFNPDANSIKRQLLELTNVIQPEDNLLIFYAGHGIWVEKEKKGYWLMTDAKRNDPNTWVSNKDVLNLIAKLPSRHTLLITDACFSGGVFKTRSITKDAPSAIQMMDAKVSRVAITSGNDTEVPDQSVFMKYLVKALSENKDQYMPAQKMFITHIMEAVMTEGKTEPRYGTLELAGHVGGDFIFTKK